MRLLFLGVPLLLLMGCSYELVGPQLLLEEQEVTICSSETQAIVLRGDGISPMAIDAATENPRVQLPSVCLILVETPSGDPVVLTEPICLPEERVRWVSQQQLEFDLDESLELERGTYDVEVTNPDGTSVRGEVLIRVIGEGVLIFWADPPIVFNGIATQLTIYGTNLGEAIESVSISDESGNETELEFTIDPTLPNRISAILPRFTRPGTYDLFVRDSFDCVATLPGGIDVSSELTLTLSSIAPTFGWTERSTPVTITGDGFQSVPRVYLNPVEPTLDTVASSLQSVALFGTSRITAVIPERIPVGGYDLIVVNPDGAVGLIEDTFLVTEAAPPEVDNVSPGSLTNDSDQEVTIEGRNFRDSTVTIICVDPTEIETVADGVVDEVTAESISAILPVNGLAAGTVCIVRVVNSDGSYEDYSAVGIMNPSANIAPWTQGTELSLPRRALALARGRATRAARFLYAIGGDSGSTDTVFDSVESAPVDIFGVPGDWFDQPVRLDTPRTLAAVVTIGRFLYLVGGNDGTGPSDLVSRAEVLDPADAPSITDVVARRGDGEGIGAGIWYYRVSAVMADDDPDNPGGETLPSDPLSLNLPEELDDTVVLTIRWEPIPGARGYRVYRSPEPSLSSDSELLLAEVEGGETTSYEDVSGTPSGQVPRMLGATGVWVAMPRLSTPREGVGVATAQDPEDDSVWHIYAIGGRDDSGILLESVEWLSVTVTEDDSQTTSATWTTGTDTLDEGRTLLSALSVSHSEAIRVPTGTTYIYAAGGEGSTNVDVAEVLAGGALSEWIAVDELRPNRSGYAAFAGADSLFAFGGLGGNPDDGGVSAEIDPPPELVNWNNEGERLIVPRYLCGGVLESAFMYIVGGVADTGLTATMERTVL